MIITKVQLLIDFQNSEISNDILWYANGSDLEL